MKSHRLNPRIFVPTLLSLFVLLALLLANTSADAKRLGGGRSYGQQSNNVTQRHTPPAAAPNSNNAAANSAPAARPRPWAGMLGGLAAGLGLAWLASSLGLSGAMAGMLSILLVVALIGIGIFFLTRLLRKQAMQASGASASHADPSNSSYKAAYSADAPTAGGSRIGSGIGSGIASGAATSTASPSTLSGAQTWGIPADFDVLGFLQAAKAHYIALQKAWDTGDIKALRVMMTEEMIIAIQPDLASRQPNEAQHTEVLSLDAKLLGIEEIQSSRQYLASVEFSGMIREESGSPATPLLEVWNLAKPMAGGGWLVAGIQTDAK